MPKNLGADPATPIRFEPISSAQTISRWSNANQDKKIGHDSYNILIKLGLINGRLKSAKGTQYDVFGRWFPFQ